MMSDHKSSKRIEKNLTHGRKWENTNQLLLESPLYLVMFAKMFVNKISLKGILKANWGLPLGGLESCSKYEVQQCFNQKYFPKTILLKTELSIEVKQDLSKKFLEENSLDYPIIFKPDLGRIGKGIFRVDNEIELNKAIKIINSDYLVQEFVSLKKEYGLFYMNHKNQPRITSINSKEMPFIVGDGKLTTAELIEKSPRLKRFSKVFSKKIDYSYVPKQSEKVFLSYIGNHSQAASFYDRTDLVTDELLTAINKTISTGFNYGRFDLKAESDEALQAGDFTIIEVNGVDSLTTAIFDPKNSLFDAYKVLYRQYSTLIKIAKENRAQKVTDLSLYRVLRNVFTSEKILEDEHQLIIDNNLR